MPKELIDITWSCRHPIFTVDGVAKCEGCHSCVEQNTGNIQNIPCKLDIVTVEKYKANNMKCGLCTFCYHGLK